MSQAQRNKDIELAKGVALRVFDKVKSSRSSCYTEDELKALAKEVADACI
jgi:hypothetical protein